MTSRRSWVAGWCVRIARYGLGTGTSMRGARRGGRALIGSLVLLASPWSGEAFAAVCQVPTPNPIIQIPSCVAQGTLDSCFTSNALPQQEDGRYLSYLFQRFNCGPGGPGSIYTHWCSPVGAPFVDCYGGASPPATASPSTTICDSIGDCLTRLYGRLRTIVSNRFPPKSGWRGVPKPAVGGVRGRGPDDLTLQPMAGYGLPLAEHGPRALLIQQVSFPPAIATTQVGIPFVWDDRGDGDWLSILIENQVVWQGVGTDFDEDTLTFALIPATGLAGTTKAVSFILKGTGQENAKIVVWNTREPEILAGPFPQPFTHESRSGDGTAGFAGDGGPAVAARLDTPGGIAVDAEGNLFVADEQNHRIRRIDALTGDIETYAGTGTAGSGGDGGPATSAQLSSPSHVALDAEGNIFIADRGNHRIRRVDAVSLEIATVAGDGTAGYDGDNLPATASSLNAPSAVAVDADGNLFVADRDNQRIRKVDAVTQNLVNVAGTGSAAGSGDGPALSRSLNYPEGVTLEDGTHLLVADTKNHQVRRIDLQAETITRVAGSDAITGYSDGELALAVGILEPATVAVGPGGDFYVAERGTHSILFFDAGSQRIRRLAGTGVAGYSSDETDGDYQSLHTPAGIVALPSGEILVTERGNHRLRALTPQVADLEVSFDQIPQRLIIGQPATVVARVTNQGPLPQRLTLWTGGSLDHVSFSSLSPSVGTCEDDLPAECSLGTLAAGEFATVTFQALGTFAETASLTFSATGSRSDLDPADDTLTISLPVLPAVVFSDGFESGNVTPWSASSGHEP